MAINEIKAGTKLKNCAGRTPRFVSTCINASAKPNTTTHRAVCGAIRPGIEWPSPR